jgi:hypothetical protein
MSEHASEFFDAVGGAEVDAHTGRPVLRVTLGVVAAVLISIIVNTGVALATTSLDPNGEQTGLALIAYGPLTALGVLAGTGGWAAVRRFSARPRPVLRVVVPAVVAISFVPGIILLAAGAGLVNVLGLWIMHLVVAAATVTMAGRVLPLPDKNI